MVDPDQSMRDCLRMDRETLHISSRLIHEAEASILASAAIVADCKLLIAEHHARREERRKDRAGYGNWFR